MRARRIREDLDVGYNKVYGGHLPFLGRRGAFTAPRLFEKQIMIRFPK
jgi:hypothetical protein